MWKLAAMAGLVMFATAANAKTPTGFQVWPSSLSPDHRLGVLVPDADHAKDNEHQNQLVEVATGKVIAVIDADTFHEHMNHNDIASQWSADGANLVWYVEGKWGSFALVVVHLDHGKVLWQTNVRELAVQEALRAARKLDPKAYAAAKDEGKTNGGWFRDGFAIDVRPEIADAKKQTLPLKFAIDITSNPKQLDEYPKAARFDASMSATLDANGKLTFTPMSTLAAGAAHKPAE